METAATTATRGRPKAFSEDAVLDALVQLFWEKGYEATSMADIVATSGLSKSSLYNSFGSKEALFDRALNRYVDFRTAMLSGILHDGEQGLADLHTLFDMLELELEQGNDHKGCLAVNTSTELGLRDDKVVEVGARYRSILRTGLMAALSRAADAGEITPERLDDRAAMLLSFVIGTAVIVRSGAPDDEILAHIAAGRALVESFRI